MTGPFAPVLSEPGKANISPVSTVVAPQFTNTSPLPGIAQAAAQGVDLFLKIQKRDEDRRIDAELDKIEQQTVDQAVGRNIATPETQEEDDLGAEQLPVQAATELQKLDRMGAAAEQGRISTNELMLRRMAGIRALKTQFPDRIGAINAKTQQLWGYRPSNVLINRALRDEKAAEAEQQKFTEAAVRASWHFIDPATGEVGPPKLPNGEIDMEKAITLGGNILAAQNKAETLAKMYAAQKAALDLRRAQRQDTADARKESLELDESTAAEFRTVFEDNIRALVGTKALSVINAIDISSPDEKTQENLRATGQQLALSIEEAINNTINSPNSSFPGMNDKTRKSIIDYMQTRKAQMLEIFTQEDLGLLELQTRMIADRKNSATLRMLETPELLNMTVLGGNLSKAFVDRLYALDIEGFTKLGRQVQGFIMSKVPDIKQVTKDQAAMMEDANAVATFSPEQSVVSLKVARQSMESYAKSPDPMDNRAAQGFFNVQMNLFKSAASLPNVEDKREAALYASNETFYRRMEELEAINPEAAKQLGQAALTVINNSVIATGAQLRNQRGFGTNWTVEYDPAEGGFVAKALRISPDRGIIGDELFPARSPRGDIEAFAERSDLDTAAAAAADMNAGLRTIDEYGDLNQQMEGMTRLQRREVVAAAALLANTDGSTTTFKSAEERAKKAAQSNEHFANVGDMLTANIRAMQRARLGSFTNRLAQEAEQNVKRMVYDPKTKTIRPAEDQ